MTRFGSLQLTFRGRTPTNMAFLRAALQHINDILHRADYKAGLPSHVLQFSVNLKQNTKTCIKSASASKHCVCHVLRHAFEVHLTSTFSTNRAR